MESNSFNSDQSQDQISFSGSSSTWGSSRPLLNTMSASNLEVEQITQHENSTTAIPESNRSGLNDIEVADIISPQGFTRTPSDPVAPNRQSNSPQWWKQWPFWIPFCYFPCCKRWRDVATEPTESIDASITRVDDEEAPVTGNVLGIPMMQDVSPTSDRIVSPVESGSSSIVQIRRQSSNINLHAGGGMGGAFEDLRHESRDSLEIDSIHEDRSPHPSQERDEEYTKYMLGGIDPEVRVFSPTSSFDIEEDSLEDQRKKSSHKDVESNNRLETEIMPESSKVADQTNQNEAQQKVTSQQSRM